MKILKFRGFKAQWVLDGTKTATLRLFDDKDLTAGDELELIDSDTNKIFAHAVITEVIQKELGAITDRDLIGHEKWKDHDDMYASFRAYYGDSVGPKTIAKLVRFKLHS